MEFQIETKLQDGRSIYYSPISAVIECAHFAPLTVETWNVFRDSKKPYAPADKIGQIIESSRDGKKTGGVDFFRNGELMVHADNFDEIKSFVDHRYGGGK